MLLFNRNYSIDIFEINYMQSANEKRKKHGKCTCYLLITMTSCPKVADYSGNGSEKLQYQ